MKVSVDAFVASSSFGGFISYIGGICGALAARDDVELHVLIPAGQEVPEFIDLPSAAQVHRIELPLVEGEMPGVTWTDSVLPVAVERVVPDVHVGPAFMLPPGHDLPQAVTVHDDMFDRFPQFYSKGIRAYLDEQTRRALSVADVVLSVSASTRRDVIERWDPAVPVEVTLLAPRLVGEGTGRRPQAAPEEFLLNVGGSHRRKRLDHLIEAFSESVVSGAVSASLHLVIIGAQGDEYVEELRAQSPVPDRIVLTGRVPDAELVDWYKSCEMFVYPSEYEGFGLGPLEAMAAGAPVLTYSNSALVEVLGEAAAFATPGVEGIRAAMEELLRYPARLQTVQEQGVVRAAGFSWARTADATVKALQGAIDRFHGEGR